MEGLKYCMRVVGPVKKIRERIGLGVVPVNARYKIPKDINKKYIVDMKLGDGEVVEISMRSTGWLQVANLEIGEILGTMRYVLNMCSRNNRRRFIELIPGNAVKSALGVSFSRVQNIVDSYNNDVGDLNKTSN
jgi:hypothetical protein